MSTAIAARMSADEFWEWIHSPNQLESRWELEAGEVIEVPSPGELHGVICAWVVYLLWSYVVRRGHGGVTSNDTGLIVARDPDTVRGPDIMLFDESLALDQLNPKFVERLPLLVVEVLSPSDQLTKMQRRIKQFLRREVPLVWLIDPEERTVTVFRPGREYELLGQDEQLTGEDVLPGLSHSVREIFTPAGMAPQS